ncbi:MAG: TIGR01244 family phosphatase [Alphaproteobacteria bacterium]|nr:TIGR01244 family phosphatase [Alphaproteobacteria bacterium]
MEFKNIDDGLAVAGQIASGDLSRAAEQGFKTVINVRPDGEQADAMTAGQARDVASSTALDYYHLPVLPTQITDEDVAAFKALLTGADGPVLAYCGTGMRATVLWALANAGTMSAQEILHKAASAGFDLSRVAPRIEQAANVRM